MASHRPADAAVDPRGHVCAGRLAPGVRVRLRGRHVSEKASEKLGCGRFPFEFRAGAFDYFLEWRLNFGLIRGK